MYARMSTIQMDPARLDQAVAQLEEEDLPIFKQIDGFRGFTLFVERSSGKVVGVSYWSTKEQMDASEGAVQASRQRAADTGGATEPPRIERFEVAIDTFIQ